MTILFVMIIIITLSFITVMELVMLLQKKNLILRYEGLSVSFVDGSFCSGCYDIGDAYSVREIRYF